MPNINQNLFISLYAINGTLLSFFCQHQVTLVEFIDYITIQYYDLRDRNCLMQRLRYIYAFGTWQLLTKPHRTNNILFDA